MACMGSREEDHPRLRNLTSSELEAKWQKLGSGNYKKASDATARYNCMAFANDNERKWWQAGLYGGRYYWPPYIPDTLEGWVKIFTEQNYELTSNREIEAGFEKIAIYVDLGDMLPSHVAKSDGRIWKSKLGRFQDIEHSSLDLLEGDQRSEYGIVERILRRPLKNPRKKKASVQ
jgi:hypothetical protein